MLNFEENINYVINEKYIKDRICNINDIIIKNKLLNNYNSCISSLIKEIDNKDLGAIKIFKYYKYFIPKYSRIRNINYLLKKGNKKIKLKQIKFNKSFIIHYSLLYIFLFLNKSKFDYDKSKPIYNNLLFSFSQFFKLLKIFYQNELLSNDEIISILQFFLIHIKINQNDLPANIKVNELTICINTAKKIINIINTTHNNNYLEYIDKIFKEIIIKILDIINDKNNIEHLSLISNFRKEENIFIILKLLKKNEECINSNTIKIIEDNIIEFLVTNFRKEHLNYFYKIIRKILIKFNYLKKNEDYSLLLKQDFSFINKINDIIKKVIDKEKEIFNNKEKTYYCDKGFVFNNKKNNNYGLSIKKVINNFNKKEDNNFCMIFTFLLKDNNKNDENIIISILDVNNKEILSLYLKGKTLYLRYFSKALVQSKITEDIIYNYYYSFFLFYDRKQIRISINNEDKFVHKESKFEIPKEFNINIGFFELNNNEKTFTSFNGIIYPIILFYLKDGKNKKDNIYKEMKDLLFKIKNKYYIIGEKYSFNDDYNTILNYYSLFDELKTRNKAIEIYNKIKNIILYVNPSVVINAFNKKAKIYKDEKIYNESTDTKNKITQYEYEFNVTPSLDNDYIYAFKDYNIVSFFKLNNGLNYLILQIEVMYNFILLMKYNNFEDNNYNYNKSDFDLM